MAITMPSAMNPTANPDITTTQTTASTAPDWYNNFISSIGSGAQNAITTGGVAGASPLQTAAYNAAPTAINAGQPALTEATNVATGAAAGPDINQFMNPYTTGVVNEIGRLGQKNFTDILAPNAVAGAAGSGQFGSRRGMQVYGDVARDVSNNITGQQTGALQSGYKDAVTAALQEQQNRTLAANTLGTLSGQAYTQGTGGLNVLSGLGAQQQATEQAGLNYPMTAVSNAAKAVSGLNIPMATTQTTKSPQTTGFYQPSPLNQIGSLITGLGSAASQDVSKFGITGQAAGTTLASYLQNILTGGSGGSSSGTSPTTGTVTTGTDSGTPVTGGDYTPPQQGGTIVPSDTSQTGYVNQDNNPVTFDGQLSIQEN